MDIQTLARLLTEAGDNIILPGLTRQDDVQTKADGSLVTKTDMACQSFIQQRLLQMDAGIGFLGEEMSVSDQKSCLEAGDSYWCLDPLDGTTNFSGGFPVFAISLALIDNGRPVLACIYDPILRETFAAKCGQGAWLNGARIRASETTAMKESVGFIDFKRLPAGMAMRLASKPGYRSQRNIGSCVLEWCWMATGRAQFILHGGEQLWDYAAGLLIAEEAGCIVSDFSGGRPFDKQQLSSPIAAACNKTIHRQIMKQLVFD